MPAVSFSGKAPITDYGKLRKAPRVNPPVNPQPRALDGKVGTATGVAVNLSTTGLPNMTVTDITWTPVSPNPGDHVIFSATVRNTGSGPTPPGTIVDVRFTVLLAGVEQARTVEDTYTSSIGTTEVVVLTATGSSQPGVNYWTAVAGTYDIDAWVNSATRFQELDATNNHRTESINVSAPVATVPAAPVLTAVAGIGTVALSWTVPADGGSPLTAYRVRRNAVVLNPPNSTVPPNTAYTDNAVVNGTQYSYTVAAVNAVGESAQSAPQLATPFSSSGVPVLPADVVQAVPASRMTHAGGMYGIYNSNSRGTVNDWGTWIGWGVGGHVFCLGGVGITNTQLGRGTTGAGGGSNYKWQRAQEGLTVNGVNQVSGTEDLYFANADYGPKFAKAKYPNFKFYLGSPKWYRWGNDWFDDAQWAAAVTKMGNLAGMVRFFGASGFYEDTEDLNIPSGSGWGWGSPLDLVNHTQAQYNTMIEQRGYEIGIAMYTACPGLEIIAYDPVPAGTWYADNVYGGGFETSSNLGNNKMLFNMGIMRAGAELGTGGSWSHLDHRLGYYMSPGVTGANSETASKWSIYGMMSRFSRELAPAVRDYYMDKLNYRWFTWISNTGKVGTYAYNHQLSPQNAAYAWMFARKWSMGGEFAEFQTTNPGPNGELGDGRPDGYGGPPSIYYNGKQVYHSDPIIINALLTTSSTTPDIDSTPITMGTISQSRVANTVTVTVPTVSHKMGIRYVGYRLYAANGTTVTKTGKAVMTWNLNGANSKSLIDDFNPYMDCTMTIANATPGLWVILDFCSGKDQHTYRRLQML